MSTGGRHTAEITAKCSACGRRLRPAETWCSLCHTVVPSVPVVPSGPSVPRQAESAPAAGRDGPVELDPAVDAVATRLLVELSAAESFRERGSGLGSVKLRLGGFGERTTGILVAVIGGMLLLVVAILGLTLLGLLV
jgi:hypothetical protein